MSKDVRIDKWLWAARFFKTRALAREAVAGGKVQVDGHRVKPGRSLKIGQRLAISRGEERLDITVAQATDRRLSASLAQQMFLEDPASIERRAAQAQQRQLDREARLESAGRPSKRERRKIIEFQKLL